MKLHEDSAAVDVYAIINNASYSYTPINKILSHFHYTVIIIPLDEFEKKFRELFHLRVYKQQEQNKPVTLVDKDGKANKIFITDELFNKLSATGNMCLLENGYVVLLKKTFMLYTTETEKVVPADVNTYMATVKEFAETLQTSMRITGYSAFSIKNIFVKKFNTGKIFTARQEHHFSVEHTTINFKQKDNYFIKLYLNFAHKLQPRLQTATKLFAHALEKKDAAAQYLQFLKSLEICFCSSKTAVQPNGLAKYIYVLVNENEKNFYALDKQINEMYYLKHLMCDKSSTGNNTELQQANLLSKIKWLETINRETLKKIIRFNHIKKESLLLMLEKRFEKMIC